MFRLCVVAAVLLVEQQSVSGEDYNLVNPDGSFDFGYETPDSYHRSQGNRNNVVRGEFGARSPATGTIDTVQYTAGPRGFRPRGKNIARKYDFNQAGPRPVGSADDPNFDPSEDPSYNFAFNTGVYNRQEAANSIGDVSGRYTYLDDVGERHNVEFIAGERTGFHVKTPYPDSNPRATGPLYFNGRGRPIPRGRTSIQRGLDGSYKFVSAGPDQRRTEISDSTGHVRGSYTYLDDKGEQHSVHYIAGPETGYRVLKTVKGPHLPTIFPFSRPGIVPPDFYDYLNPNNIDLFDTAASGNVIPPTGGGNKPTQPDASKKDQTGFANGVDLSNVSGTTDKTSTSGFDSFGASGPSGTVSPQNGGTVTRPFGNRQTTPSYDDDNLDVFSDDIFGPFKPKPDGGAAKPTRPLKPLKPSYSDDGSYKPTGDDGLYTSKDFNEVTTGGKTDTSIFTNDFGFGDKDVSGTKKPLYEIGVGSRPSRPSEGTIVRNVGDRFFAIPPGATARAHVQAIDLLDVKGRALSPSEQLRAESSEQDFENTEIKEEYTTPSTKTTVSHKETTTVKNGTDVETLPL